jgi:hypothetical protein
MTSDEKIRLGMLALLAVAAIAAVHVGHISMDPVNGGPGSG